MLLKEMIKENYEYKMKQPLELKELKEYINTKYKKNFSATAVRNILLDNPSEDLGYYSSYKRGIYLPFKADAEEEVITRYSNNRIYPLGRFLSVKLGLSNQVFQNGSYIVFSDSPLQINNRDKIITKNNYYFVSGASEEIKTNILLLLELVIKVKFDVFIEYSKEVDDLMKWYENEYQNVLKTLDLVGVVNNDEFNLDNPWDIGREYTSHILKTGMIVELKPLPKAFDFNFIGVMKVLKNLSGDNE